jgi:hypothetical protein
MTDDTDTSRRQSRPHQFFPRTAASSPRWLGGILVAALSSGCASQSFEDCSTQRCAPSHVIARDGSWTRAAAPSRNRAWLSGLNADPDGNFLLGLWEGSPSARRYSAGEWSSATQVSCMGCFDYVLKGNTRGDAFALAVNQDGRAFARQYRQGSWVDGNNVADLDGYLPQTLVTGAMAPNGEAHVLVVDDKVMRSRQTDSTGVWSDGQNIPLSDTTYFQPVIAFDSQGDGSRPGWRIARTTTGAELISSAFRRAALARCNPSRAAGKATTRSGRLLSPSHPTGTPQPFGRVRAGCSSATTRQPKRGQLRRRSEPARRAPCAARPPS